MADAASSADVRVDLSSGRPQGLPFLKPLYGPGPYDFTNGMVLMVSYTADEQAVREVLPRPLEPHGEPTVAMTFWVWPECTGIGPHSFSMPIIPVRYGDFVGSWIPYLYTSTDASLACYREVQGWPAVLGNVELTHAKGQVRARVLRNGREVISASAEVGGDAITELGDFAPVILYKEIPSLDTTGTDVATFITSTSRLTNIEMHGGTGSVRFPDAGDDPVARLAPVSYQGAVFGSLDDHYPESIRTLEPLATAETA
jgi:acetoacetate decarboxylase